MTRTANLDRLVGRRAVATMGEDPEHISGEIVGWAVADGGVVTYVLRRETDGLICYARGDTCTLTISDSATGRVFNGSAQ